jgi:hypothetical protein
MADMSTETARQLLVGHLESAADLAVTLGYDPADGTSVGGTIADALSLLRRDERERAPRARPGSVDCLVSPYG